MTTNPINLWYTCALISHAPAWTTMSLNPCLQRFHWRNWTTLWTISHIPYPYSNLPPTICCCHFHDNPTPDNNTLTNKTIPYKWASALFTQNYPFGSTIPTDPSYQPPPSASFSQPSLMLGTIFDPCSLNHHTTTRITKHPFCFQPQ